MSWLSWILSNVLLALLLSLAAWSVQRRRPAIAHTLWVLVLIKLVTPPLVSVPLGESPVESACAAGTCDCGQHTQGQTFVANTLPWVLLSLWLAGAGATAWVAWCRWSQFRRLVALAIPAPADWQSLSESLCSELSIRELPEILVVPGQLPPMVIPGRHRPLLLLPMDLLDQLNAAQRVALLLHELVHIKRGDHLVRLLELTVGVAFWWLPFVRAIGRQLRACEEACCDAAVVARRPEARRDYAALLLDVIDFVTPVPVQATAMSAARGLERRLRAILHDASGKRRSWPPAGVFALILAFTILPCELHYDMVGRPTPAIPAISDPTTDVAPPRGGERKDQLPKTVCCPS